MQDWGASPATYISLAVGWGFKIFPWMCFVWLCLTSLFCLTLFNFSALFDFSAFHTSSLSACQQVLHSWRKRVHKSKTSKRIFKIMVWVLLFWICSHCKAVQLIHLQCNTMQVLHQLRTFSRCRRDQRWEIGRMEKISTGVLCRWRILACEKCEVWSVDGESVTRILKV